MINIVYGDMIAHIKSKEHLDSYGHQCNCHCQMGSGIAPLMKKTIIGLEAADNSFMGGIGDIEKMGKFSFAEYNGVTGYNIYGQYHWRKYQVVKGRNTDYPFLENGLNLVKQHMITNGLKTLGLPLIGCGLAGGDWDNVVFPMIQEIFGDDQVDVTIFILK